MQSRYVSATPVAGQIPFDNSENGFVADDVQSAIEEAKASSGGGGQSFSVSEADLSFTIPLNRQMLVYQEFSVQPDFEVNLLGELVLID